MKKLILMITYAIAGLIVSSQSHAFEKEVKDMDTSKSAMDSSGTCIWGD